MTGTSVSPTLQLLDFLKPQLPAGTYTITADHAVDLSSTAVTGGPPKQSARHAFTVQGPRFSLDPSEIHALYPPASAVGLFAGTFPHVVVTTRALPWEREVDVDVTPGDAAKPLHVPWLALLVLDAAEVPGGAGTGAGPTGAVAMDVKTLVAGGGGVVAPAIASSVSGDEQALQCQVLKVPASLFAAVAPTAPELPYLAHVRRLDASTAKDVDAADVGWFALVAGNRTPTPGGRSVAHLVSLEGHQALLGGTATGTEVWLVSLASWSFTDTTTAGDATNGNVSFGAVAAPLAQVRAGERQDLALGLPAGGSDAVAARLHDGYVPVGYHLPTGEDTFAWYRGPFAARPGAPADAFERPFASSSAALAYEPATGLFDVSLAVAWEIGRALALADRTFTLSMLRFRRSAHRVVDLIVAGLDSKHIDTSDGNLQKIAQRDLIDLLFLDSLRSGLTSQVAAASSGSSQPAQGTQTGSGLPADPFTAVKAVVESPDLAAVVAAEVAGDAAPVAGWLDGLRKLHLVPFTYLVPHPGLLPDESIRFFEVDASWTGALVDGALSVGVQSSRDAWFQLAAPTIVADAWSAAGKKGAAAGLLVRSSLIAGWPGLTVVASAGGTRLDVVRSEPLGANVLVCLFSGVPDEVQLLAPHQSLHLAAVDGVHWRAGDGRILDVAASAQAFGATGSASLARHLLAARDRLTFDRNGR